MEDDKGTSDSQRGHHSREDASAAFWDAKAPDPMPAQPERVGSYRILEPIGAGGMGVVYRAEQENPRRVIALKVIRAGVTSPSMLRRFRGEAQLLGRLHHPGIAQIYEAGTAGTDQGAQPFIAMELIEGQSITAHARDRELGTRARLELMGTGGERLS